MFSVRNATVIFVQSMNPQSKAFHGRENEKICVMVRFPRGCVWKKIVTVYRFKLGLDLNEEIVNTQNFGEISRFCREAAD